jgi:hypothetical protein
MTALLFARNETHADELIAELIRDCAEGKSDRESEALRLAKQWGIKEPSVAERFAEARDALQERLRERQAKPEEESWVAKFRRRKWNTEGEGPQIDAALNVPATPDDKAQLDAALAGC